MLYACVQRFDVTGTVEFFLKTKQAIKPILLPKFSNLSAAAHRLFFLKRTGEALLEKKRPKTPFFISTIWNSQTGSMNLKKPFLDRICDASPLFLPYANLSVDEANNQEARRVHPGHVRCII